MWLHSVVILGLMLGWTVADGAAKGKKDLAGAIKGVIKDVQPDKNKPGTVTIAVQSGKKKAAPSSTSAEPKKITVNADTKVEKLDPAAKSKKEAKKPGNRQPAQVSDLQAKSRVFVVLKSGSDNVAERVILVPRGKKKATNQ